MEKFQKRNIETPKDLPENKKMSEQDLLQKDLKDWVKKMEARHQRKRSEAIDETLKNLRKKQKSEKKEADEPQEKEENSRVTEYRKVLDDKEESNKLRDYAYPEVSEWKFNHDRFHGEGGWLAEYNNLKNTDLTLEEFVLKKQYAELERMRIDMLEARTSKIIPELYSDLQGDGAEVKEKRAKKTADTIAKTKEYFSSNRASINKYLKSDAADATQERAKLYKSFVTDVFGNDLKPELLKEGGVVDVFFQDLLDDYVSMLAQRNLVKEMNPLMVEMMSEDVTEEVWKQRLSKQNKEKAEQLEKEKAKENVLNVNYQSYNGDLSRFYYGSSLNSAEKLGSDSLIVFQPVAGSPGNYEIKYPSPNKTGEEITNLQVRMVKDPQTGELKRYYIFNDDSIDHPTVVDEKEFRAQVNARFLDHVMNDGVKHGQDYLGPSINEILHDNEMFNLAQQLYRPERDLREYVLTPKDTESFKALIKVLTNKSNIQAGIGDYGDLKPINNRIALLKYVLSLENGSKAPALRQILLNAGEGLNNLSIEGICKSLKIPANFGNFARI